VHPGIALLGLGLALAALRLGLGMRRRRRLRQRPDTASRRRHLVVAKLATALVLGALVVGPISSIWLRGWTPFERLHGWMGISAALLFSATAIAGHGLERGRHRALDAHALLALAAVAGGALAFATGFVLLP